MGYSEILRLVPTLQATALVGTNLRLVKKRKKKAKDFLDTGFTNVVGSSIISSERAFLDY